MRGDFAVNARTDLTVAAQVSIMEMFGLGLTIAVIADASLVRMLLMPALMHLLGKYNWWAPAPLRRFHQHFGIDESGNGRGTEPSAPASVEPGVPINTLPPNLTGPWYRPAA